MQRLRRTVPRLGIGLGLGALPPLAGLLLPPSGPLAAVDWSAAVHLSSALLVGPLGWLGGIVAQLAAAILAGGRLSPIRLTVVAAMALPGLVAYLLFRRSPRLSRTLPNLGSYLTLAAVAAAGGVLGGMVASWFSFRGFHPLAATMWSSGLTVGSLLATPILLLAAGALPPTWLAPETTNSGDEDRPSPLGPGSARLALGLAGTLLLAVVVTLLARQLPAAASWLNLLLVPPVLLAAELAGLRGGVAIASVAGISLLGLRTLVLPSPPSLADHLQGLAVLPPLVLFGLLGALRGAARDRERALSTSLEQANRLLREDLEQTVRAFSTAIEAKDAYTEEHVERVAAHALAVGEQLGLAGDDLVALQWAAMLHDLGKIGIPESVLNKPGPLDDGERVLVRRHPEIGARILAHIPGMKAAAPLVHHHQERYDGRTDGPFPGYPAGLAGEAIPLGARIIAVVDTYDALTSDRPYRRACSPADAQAELLRERGRQFDPRVVDAFLGLLPPAAGGTLRPRDAQAPAPERAP